MDALFSLSKVVLLALCLAQIQAGKLKEEFTWSYISFADADNSQCMVPASKNDDFAFPGADNSRDFKLPNLPNEEYIGENNIPMGVNRYEDKLFITVPRRRVGIPATLNFVSLSCKNRHNVPLTPYPNWELNQLNGSRPADTADLSTPFVSVYRTTIDVCRRLWFVDMGILEYPTGRQQVQPATVVVMDLVSNRVIRRYPLKATDANPQSTFADITIDVNKNNCDDAFAYIPDLVNARMIVYSLKQQDSWVVDHNFFHFQPRGGELHIGGHRFTWNDGLFSIVLSRPAADGYRTAYFHAMASTEEFGVSTQVLRNKSLAARGYHGEDFKFVGDRGKDGQSSTHAIHSPSGVVFFAEVNRDGLSCWNSHKPWSKESYQMLHADPAKMIYPGDVTVDLQDNVWMMTNSMPIFIYGKLDYSKTNFRAWSGSVRDLVKGTKCDPTRR